ncbi:MAG: hypothetical protein MUO68_21985 [Desulfobacteraceae bacterium]|nr:hypothetical protein [Desulfobacteraceae bacterium]
MRLPLPDDIRDKPYLEHNDILQLNFIRNPGRYIFRRHYRAGLRSHLMEVLNPEDVELEKRGVIVNGLRMFPRAIPLKMLRILRRRFNSLSEAREELRRVKIVESYLAPDHIARPAEFLVHYVGPPKWEILLAGLQEYVSGEVLEPWGDLGRDLLISILARLGIDEDEDRTVIVGRWEDEVRKRAQEFITRLKKMIVETKLVPDLAGIGNLILTRTGDIKLVDINNISEVSFDPVIRLDDKGYPVCDRSVIALSHLEQELLGIPPQMDDPIYGTFLDPERIEKVKEAEKKFYLSMKPVTPYLNHS